VLLNTYHLTARWNYGWKSHKMYGPHVSLHTRRFVHPWVSWCCR